jgi:hypothetical protein
MLLHYEISPRPSARVREQRNPMRRIARLQVSRNRSSLYRLGFPLAWPRRNATAGNIDRRLRACLPTAPE